MRSLPSCVGGGVRRCVRAWIRGWPVVVGDAGHGGRVDCGAGEVDPRGANISKVPSPGNGLVASFGPSSLDDTVTDTAGASRRCALTLDPCRAVVSYR